MRIIYVENVRIPSERAHAYQIVQTCAWLARFGASVELVNPDRAGGVDVFAHFGIEKNIFTHTQLPVLDALAWKWLSWKAGAYAIQRWSFVRALRRWSRTQTADIWFTRDTAMVDALKGQGRRIVLELHDRPDHQPDRWERVKKEVVGFVVITHGLKDVLVGLGIAPERVVVSPDGFDPKDFAITSDRAAAKQSLGLPIDAPTAFYAGGFYPWKGVDAVVSAWKTVPQDIHLVLIGGPEADRKRIESLIPNERRASIHVFPYRPHAEAIQLMAAGEIGLLPTSEKEEIGRSFTSPIKQFEYLAAGLPVLASDVPSSHEVLTERVARFFRPDGSDFAAVLERMMRDRAWLADASAEAKRVVQGFTWEARSRSIFDFLARLV